MFTSSYRARMTMPSTIPVVPSRRQLPSCRRRDGRIVARVAVGESHARGVDPAREEGHEPGREVAIADERVQLAAELGGPGVRCDECAHRGLEARHEQRRSGTFTCDIRDADGEPAVVRGLNVEEVPAEDGRGSIERGDVDPVEPRKRRGEQGLLDLSRERVLAVERAPRRRQRVGDDEEEDQTDGRVPEVEREGQVCAEGLEIGGGPDDGAEKGDRDRPAPSHVPGRECDGEEVEDREREEGAREPVHESEQDAEADGEREVSRLVGLVKGGADHGRGRADHAPPRLDTSPGSRRVTA